MSIPEPLKAGGKRERTRAALVAATLAVVAEKGVAAASLDEIAARAGMTKGAIYSNFTSKAGLLLAAMMAKGLTVESAAPAGETLADHVRAMADGLIQTIRRARGEQALLAEFQIHALTDPELRAGLGDVYAASFKGTAAYLARMPGASGAMASQHLAVALQSIALGLMVQSFLTPDEVTDAVIRETLETFAAGLERPAKPA
jgi:AcrR family transcriptional regulator